MKPFDFETLRCELREAGVSLWIEEPDTLVVWPSTKLTADQIEILRQHKPAIIAAHRRRMIDLLPSDEVCREWRRKYCNTENHHERRNITDETGNQPAERTEVHRAENR